MAKASAVSVAVDPVSGLPVVGDIEALVAFCRQGEELDFDLRIVLLETSQPNPPADVMLKYSHPVVESTGRDGYVTRDGLFVPLPG